MPAIPTDQTFERPLTVEEAGALVGCSARTISRLLASGALPAIKAGGRTRVRRADVIAHFTKPTRSPALSVLRPENDH